MKWEGSGIELAGEYIFLYRNVNENQKLSTGVCAEENHINS
jgi:hypothetical protein